MDETVEKKLKTHEHNGRDALRVKFSNIKNDLIQAAITAPTGGGTVDTQARTAINAILTALQALNLTK